MSSDEFPAGFIRHDGGPCPVALVAADAGSVQAIYRRDATKIVTLFVAGLEQWEWTGAKPGIEIVAYLPPPSVP